jgi:hypothetical protein
VTYGLKLGNADVSQMILITSSLSMTKNIYNLSSNLKQCQFQTNPCIVCWFGTHNWQVILHKHTSALNSFGAQKNTLFSSHGLLCDKWVRSQQQKGFTDPCSHTTLMPPCELWTTNSSLYHTLTSGLPSISTVTNTPLPRCNYYYENI